MSQNAAPLLRALEDGTALEELELDTFLEQLCAALPSSEEFKEVRLTLLKMSQEVEVMARVEGLGSSPLATLQSRRHHRLHDFYFELTHWLTFWEVAHEAIPSTVLLEAIWHELREISERMRALGEFHSP